MDQSGVVTLDDDVFFDVITPILERWLEGRKKEGLSKNGNPPFEKCGNHPTANRKSDKE